MKDLVIGGRKFSSRFFLGTGKFASGELLKEALAASGTELVTTALTRVHEGDAAHDDILKVIDRSKVEVMLNTSGARTAAEAVRRMLLEANTTADALTSEERLHIISELEKHGYFRLKGAVREVTEVLHCSQASVYRYLTQLRRGAAF